MRGTGGNRFIPSDATRGDLMASINDQLGDLQEWADETDRVFDIAEISIATKRIPSGRISVSVEADLAPRTTPTTSKACANYSAPVTCLTAPSTVTGRCDHCKGADHG